MAKKRLYSHEVNGWWYARVPVPKDLRDKYTVTAVKRSLKTDSQTVADQRLDAVVGEIKAEFDRKRRGGGEDERLLEFIEASQWHDGSIGTMDGNWRVRGVQRTAPIARLAGDALATKLRAALELVELYPERGYTLLDVLKIGLGGELAPVAQAQAVQTIRTELIPPAVRPYLTDMDTAPVLSLRDCMDAFWRDPARENKSQESNRHYRNVFVFLCDVLGKDTPIKSIKRDPDIRAVQSTIIYQPVRGKQRFPSMKAQDIAKRAKADADAGKEVNFIASNTRNLYLKLVSCFFRWCYTEGFIPFSPAEELQVSLKEDREETDRELFNDNDLRKLFPKGYHLTGNNWLPLVLLYSGMRAGEAAQMDVSDVVLIDNVWCFDITDETKGAENGKRYGDKTLKTPTSKRVIPIHQRLLDLGFLDYYFARRDSGAGKVFEVSKDGEGTYYPSVQPLLNEWRAAAGVIEGKKTAHSLRHNWRTAMFTNGADQALTKIMGGWTLGGGVDSRVYLAKHKIPVSVQKAELDKLSFDVL